MEEMLGYIINMLPYMIIALPILLLSRIVIYFIRRNKGETTVWLREITIIVFGLYLVGLASQTIIPKLEFSVNGIGIVGRSGIDLNRINLIPFNKLIETWETVYIEGYRNYLLIEVLGNIALFTVIGFMLPLLWKQFDSFKTTVLFCFLLSLSIEIIQLVLPRATDVDDLIMNVLGGSIGYYMYNIIKNKFPKLIYKLRLRR